ncbi:MAG: heme ABC transporter permease [Rickettsiales bacterium]
MAFAFLHALAAPGKMRHAFDAALLPLAFVCVVALAFGVYTGLVSSPPDYQQKEAVRIMYVHVPAAWTALGAYVTMGLCALAGLAFRSPSLMTLSRAIALPGATFCGICLVTGSLWGYPMWGTWWAWDARMTSTLVLFFFYVGYLLLIDAHDDAERGERQAAFLCILGLVNVPIVKFSVEWWNTLHQPASVLRSGGISIDPSMRWPLFSMFGAYLCLAAAVTMMRFNCFLVTRKAERLEASLLRRQERGGK